MYVANLFAFRSTDPKKLGAIADPIGPLNDAYIKDFTSNSILILAWGSTRYKKRAAEVLDLLSDRELWCLGTNKDGSPKHPLYVRADAPLVPFVR